MDELMDDKKPRSSERIREKHSRVFHKPTREDEWKITPTKSPNKYSHLKPRKLVNNYTRENHRYNADLYETSGDESMEDFLVDSDEQSDTTSDESDKPQTSTIKCTKKQPVRDGRKRLITITDSEVSDEETGDQLEQLDDPEDQLEHMNKESKLENSNGRVTRSRKQNSIDDEADRVIGKVLKKDEDDIVTPRRRMNINAVVESDNDDDSEDDNDTNRQVKNKTSTNKRKMSNAANIEDGNEPSSLCKTSPSKRQKVINEDFSDSDEDIVTPRRKRNKNSLIESDKEDESIDRKGIGNDNPENDKAETDVNDACKDTTNNELNETDDEEIVSPRKRNTKCKSILDSDADDDENNTNESGNSKTASDLVKVKSGLDAENHDGNVVCKTEPSENSSSHGSSNLSSAIVKMEFNCANIKTERVDPDFEMALNNLLTGFKSEPDDSEYVEMESSEGVDVANAYVKAEDVKVENDKVINDSTQSTNNEFSNKGGMNVEVPDDDKDSESDESESDDTGSETSDNTCTESSDEDNEDTNSESDEIEPTSRVRVKMLKKKQEKANLFERFRQERQRKLKKQSKP